LILLDTHAWLWWVSEPNQLSDKGLGLINEAIKNNTVFISCISTWEISLLVKKKRIELSHPLRQWVAVSERQPFISFLPITNEIVLKSNLLPGEIHQDPADRLIIATALTHQVPVLTKDRKIRDYDEVDTIW
jgi:PIN domain nuclease of toxin-antitoxin system